MTDPRIAIVRLWVHDLVGAKLDVADAERLLSRLDALAPKAEERESLRAAFCRRYEELSRDDPTPTASVVNARQIDALIDVLDDRLKGGG